MITGQSRELSRTDRREMLDIGSWGYEIDEETIVNRWKPKGPFHNLAIDDSNYETFHIPKRRGGKRVIQAPSDDLKEAQEKSYQFLRNKIFISPFAHAFCKQRNIVTMAAGHVKKPWILSIDLKDFFPSIRLDKFCEEVLSIKSLKNTGFPDGMTERQRFEAVLSHIPGHFKLDKEGHYTLPQGGPGSPFLSNVFLRNVDWMLAYKASKHDVDYSRYADDVVFSGSDKTTLWRMFHVLRNTIQRKGLEINEKKIKLRHNNQRQMVCGLVVNEKINIPRRARKNFRAELFQQRNKNGYRKDTKGRLAFHNMVYNNTKDYVPSSTYCKGIKTLNILDV